MHHGGGALWLLVLLLGSAPTLWPVLSSRHRSLLFAYLLPAWLATQPVSACTSVCAGPPCSCHSCDPRGAGDSPTHTLVAMLWHGALQVWLSMRCQGLLQDAGLQVALSELHRWIDVAQ